MKICVITATYPIDGFGGIFIKEQCEQLVANGNEVCVLYCAGCLKSNKSIRPHDSMNNGVRLLYNSFPRYATTYAPRFWCKVMNYQINKLYSLLESEEWIPDVIYAHFSFPAGRIATAIGKRTNIPVVVAEHWSGLLSGKANGPVLSIIKDTVSQASSIICVSPVLRDSVEQLTSEKSKIRIIPNMLAPEFVYVPRRKKDRFVFFSLGTLNEKKQFDLLIQAFAKAFSADEDVILRIGGSGPEMNKLKKLIDKLQRAHQISLLGRLNRDETFEEYALCDSFVLLSPKETFGIVFREALAIGRPVISLDNGGINYGWRDEFGKIIRCSSEHIVDQTAITLKEMVSRIGEYNLNTISNYALSEFSAETITNQIQQALCEAVDKKDIEME